MATGTVTFLVDGSTLGTAPLGSSGVKPPSHIGAYRWQPFDHCDLQRRYQFHRQHWIAYRQSVRQQGRHHDRANLVAKSKHVGSGSHFHRNRCAGRAGIGHAKRQRHIRDDGSTVLGTAPLGSNGQAAFTTSALSPGNHTITASYGGDSNFNASGGSLTGNPQVVKFIAPTTITLGSAPAKPGSRAASHLASVCVRIEWAIRPDRHGHFSSMAAARSAPERLAPVRAHSPRPHSTTSALSVGNHTITATYGGDFQFHRQHRIVHLVINKANTSMTLTSSANPSTSGNRSRSPQPLRRFRDRERRPAPSPSSTAATRSAPARLAAARPPSPFRRLRPAATPSPPAIAATAISTAATDR